MIYDNARAMVESILSMPPPNMPPPNIDIKPHIKYINRYEFDVIF